MSEHADPRDDAPTENRADHLRHRSRLTWAVATVAVLVIVGVIAVVLVGAGGDDGSGSAGPAVVDSSGAAVETDEAASVTELTLDASAPAARCLAPESAPQVVAAQTLAVDATVESISGGVVTLAPTTFYAGEPTDLVTVSEPGGDLQRLLAGVDFAEGERYLVSATDGRVTLCGFTARYTEALAAVYENAFAE